MCGLAVLVGDGPVSWRDGWEMLQTLRHRGPDGGGVVTFDGGIPALTRDPAEPSTSGRTLLAFVRLAIIDLTDAGFQPMADENEDIWVAFNGEIYNFRELRHKLEAGHLLSISNGMPPRIEPYWEFQYELGEGGHDAPQELRAAVEEAVERQLVSDVPLGAFFSGGIDSTSIVEIMRRRMWPEWP